MYRNLSHFLYLRRQFTVFKTLEQVAAACQIEPAEMARYESGETVPPPAVIRPLARALSLGPRIFVRVIRESQQGVIRPESIKSITRRDRRQEIALAHWMLAQDDLTPQQRTIWRVLLQRRRKHILSWYLIHPEQN